MVGDKGGYARIAVVESTTGVKNFSMLVSEIDAGYAHAEEVHAEEQAYLILRGRATVMIEGWDYEVEPDMFVSVPAHTVHQIRNTGAEPLRFLVVTSPPGKFEKQFSKPE
jgi:mannose-6-phosphate isomerase-like protein (cupin superfamily)